MTEADTLQESIYLGRKFLLYNQDILVGGYYDLKTLKEDMFKLYCDYDEEKIKEDIEVWHMVKAMNGSAFAKWLRDSLDYSFARNKTFY